MTEVNSIDVSYSRKVQLDQFEPIEHRVDMEVSLSDEDDPDEAYDEYADIAEDMVERAIAERVARKKLEPDEDD